MVAGPVTWKAVTYLLGALVAAQGTTLYWVNDELKEKVSVQNYQSQTDDIKWIKECMIKKCWDGG
jgi:hypothetical protein